MLTNHDPDAPPHVTERCTKSGRRLFYCLKVIQQPERARACGSGPKSSADRRPVDPPPVVELRIYEGQTWEAAKEKDITFLYNANFFLYATLEHARVMAHGRVQTPAANTPPVLTGMPVSGMAYLDRPQEAGYFLFPDLSVRHEGRYRLTFNLYEETKEDKDKDPDCPDSKPIAPGMSNATGGSFDFRMEVKSQDFVVYSAKKFPGLTESTHLSRVVAEQGCRVRIRRDVRMRRRDPKGGADYGDNGEDEYSRRRRTATPDTRQDPYRARSMSGGGASVERTPYSSDAQRRPSMAEYQQQPPPQFAGQSSAPGGHLQFLGNTNTQYPAQPQKYTQSSSVPPSPVYSTSQGSSYSGPSQYGPPPPYAATERTSSQSYASTNPSPRRDSITHDYSTRVSLPPLATLQPSLSSSHPSSSHPSTPQDRLPPLQNHAGLHSSSYDRPTPPRATLPLPTPAITLPPPQARHNSQPNGYIHPPPPSQAGTKRAHDQSFAIPDSDGFKDRAREQEAIDDTPKEFKYRRADGTIHCKNDYQLMYPAY